MISAEVTEELLIPAEKFVNVDVYHLPFGATAEVIEWVGFFFLSYYARNFLRKICN